MDTDGQGRRHQSVLPPRPDPDTGEPFPPPAPGPRGRRDEGGLNDVSARDSEGSRGPKPPAGRGSTLAWHRERPAGKVSAFLVALTILITLTAILSISRGDALDMLTVWQVWLVIVIFSYLMSSPLRMRTLAVGSDWYMISIARLGRRTKSGVIDTYHLKKITGSAGPTGYFLEIDDGQHASELPLHRWQQNRKIWDLVYNGILHSVADGARINKLAIQMLKIADTPALDLARQPGRASRKKQGIEDSS